MNKCIKCEYVNPNNSWCILKTEFRTNENACNNFSERDQTKTIPRCMICRKYNILSYLCTNNNQIVSVNWCCSNFKSNLDEEEYSTENFVPIVVGGCKTYEHGTDLYKRIKEWTEAIKTDNSKNKGVRVVFTKHDYPTAYFWRSLIEKLYHLYEPDWIKDKICFRGLTDEMLEEAIFVKNSIIGFNNE